MKRLRVEDIRQVAVMRPVGYVEALLSAGAVKDGWLELEEAVFDELRLKFGQACDSCVAEPEMASDAVVAGRVATCEACDDLVPGTCRCEKLGCVSLARRAAAPICCRWAA